MSGHLVDPGVDGRIILRNLQEVGCGDMDWTELANERQVAGSCECGNELSG
jgi:hypothetical protein